MSVVNAMFRFPKFSAPMTRIIKVVKSIEVDGREMKLATTSPQRGLIQNMDQGKESK